MEGTIQELKWGYEVLSEYAMSSEPTLIVHHWRVTGCQGAIDPSKPRVEYFSGSGTWRGYGITVATEEKAYKVEQIPIPAPKTKLETRWYRERWEKYTKAQGWVAA